MCVLLGLPSLWLFLFLGRAQPYTTHRVVARASSFLTMSSTTSTSNKPPQRIQWHIRPATLDDSVPCGQLLHDSYSVLLAPDYADECLQKCLPLITIPQPDLLTCPTWYVVEHPNTPGLLVGCGGWTVKKPSTSSLSTTTGDVHEQKESTTQPVNSDHPKPQSAMIPHLRHFAVHPEYSRQRIATLLWQKCIQDITEATGGSFPTLEVYSTITAQPFYQSCGFVPSEATEIRLGPNSIFLCVLMRREPT